MQSSFESDEFAGSDFHGSTLKRFIPEVLSSPQRCSEPFALDRAKGLERRVAWVVGWYTSDGSVSPHGSGKSRPRNFSAAAIVRRGKGP
jgi:hypothetical protein